MQNIAPPRPQNEEAVMASGDQPNRMSQGQNHRKAVTVNASAGVTRGQTRPCAKAFNFPA